MKAAVLHELGKVPRCEDFAVPTAGKDEVVVRVRSASLKAIDRQLARGSHYASPRELPVVCGTDGVGDLEDGTRVFFGGPRRPYGAMAERTVVPRAFCFPVPSGLDDDRAAALPNPGVSAWLSLTQRAKLAPGETVLILGATGVIGQLAVQIAKLLGARRVIGAGRNERVLSMLSELGADATIQLDQPQDSLKDAFARAAGDQGYDVIIDYLWGRPTEALLAAITKSEFAAVTKETRLVQAGESAGPTISLPAAVLRSTALTILGTAGVPSREVLLEAMQQVMARAARGELRIETERVPLADIARVWQRQGQSGRRIVVTP
ncbi:MAG TPA: zinc-binding alcohol dehydrogenase family protein [Thermoanaerobaculia bacterium]|jgi:NADPH2:quinone reductase|nr:zinc-binding alcohol dehydrogenase family protein [Thermoanaerobaculia bacterium]